MLEDRRGQLWVGTEGGGLALYNREKGEFRSVPIDYSETGSAITEIAEDRHGRLWIGTVGNGLFRFDVAVGRLSSWGTTENRLGSRNDHRGSRIRTGHPVGGGRKGMVWFGSTH